MSNNLSLFRMQLRLIFLFSFLTFCYFTSKAQQSASISGSVTTSSDNLPMIGVTVLVKGKNIGTITNGKGHYSIQASPQDTLIFRHIGFTEQQFVVGTHSNINISLAASAEKLSDVVVIGYGTQNRLDVTGAISSVKAKDLNLINGVSIDNLIQGKAAGVNVNTYTAQPGGDVSVTIRGALSPNGSNAPLYVIDGLPLTTQAYESVPTPGAFRGNIDRSPLTSINPNDIASVEILKDASATAIYGSAAANGVILITTKRGQEGKTTVNYSGTYSTQVHKKYLEPLDATQFENAVDTYGEEYWKFNNKIAPYGTIDPTTVTPYVSYFTQAQIAAAGKGTNYIDYVLRHGIINDQNISTSGGNANTKVFTSFNYFDQKALLKNSGLQRFAGRINLDQKIGSNALLSLGFSYSQVNNDNVPVGQSSDIDSPSFLQSALQFPSSIPLYDSQGNPSTAYYARTPNPASFFEIKDQTFTKRIIITPHLQVNILDGLKFNLTGGIDNNSSDNQFFIPNNAFAATIPFGDAQRRLAKTNNYSAEAYLNYDKKINESQFSAVAGVGYYESNTNGFGLDAVGFSTNAFGVNNIGIANQKDLSSVSSYKTARTKLSQFTRLNYTYNDKYILQFTGRFDGTSNFPQDHQFGFFPGVSAGWLVNHENFLKNNKWISQLKLRGGYGTTGNESITAGQNYVYSLYALTNDFSYLIGNQFYNSGFIQTQLGNPNLKWETDAQFNVGIDFGIFNNRVTGSLDYFERTAKDLLDFRVLPSENAITTQAFNVGSTRSKGLELMIKTQNIVSRNFTWETTITLGTDRAFWVNRNPAVALAPYIGYHDPIHANYGWKTDGLIRSAVDAPKYQIGAYDGNIKYLDLNGDGKLDINDVRYLGNTDPKGTFGLNNSLKYKNFDLNFFIYGSYGYLSYDGYQQFVQTGKLVRPGAPTNGDIHSLDIWTSFNLNGTYPGLANDPASANNPTGNSDFRTVKNGYFARLKDISLGYTFGKGLLGSQQKFFHSARIFVDVQNLFFITNTTGLDPEMGLNNNPYPTALTTAFGINLQF